ncbi:hypothetical protein, partial [Hyphococcus sp.]|uniref:hypothetical protein n=1 Tax=Hyphococcus sp. TaxID=2038636 RepID=UPI003751FF66
MTHFRTAIRAAAVALLKEATAAEERVFDSRLDVLGKNNLPAIKVYTSEDAGGVRELGADGAQSRSVTMIIECVIANHDDDEDDADFAARI